MVSNNSWPKIVYTPEPELMFGYGQSAIDPRDGLTLFGPLTRNVALPGRVGIMGPNQSITRMYKWLESIQKPVYSLDHDVARPFFPGFEAAFGIPLNTQSVVTHEVSHKEIMEYLMYEDSHQRIHNLANIFANKLLEYQRTEEVPVSVWFIVIPDDIYTYCRPKSRIPKNKLNIKTGIGDKYSRNVVSLFDEYNDLQEAYKYELNFHAQLKSKLLKSKIVTQIVRESTIAYKDFPNKYGTPLRDLAQFESDIAWNISATLYYKMGGVPWKLASVRDRVCFFGLVYKKMEGKADKRTACCAAQMFLDSGDGLVFKGAEGTWYDTETKEFHLHRDAAYDLLDLAIKTYESKNNGAAPKQIFIHAQTYFNDDEWSGFVDASKGKTQIIGVRIRRDSGFKVYRDYNYPVPRGFTFIEGPKKAFVWAQGFIPKIETVKGLETPNPLSVEITRGEEDIEVVCRDVLSLTKLNYNACMYGDGRPVTLSFANKIGDIITAGPAQNIDVLPFKHYI